MRVVIVDDEELARARLRRLLGAHPDVELVAELADAHHAEAALPALAPDVALLDIRMPRRDGFDLAAALAARPCAIVFITAWADHAVRAFDAGVADYLLKPVDAERLARALDRARERLRGLAATPPSASLPSASLPSAPLLSAPLPSAPPPPSPEPLAPRLAVRDRGRFVFVALHDVDAVVARGNYVELRAHRQTYSMRTTLSALEARLDPAAFVRIHRSVILRIERIASIEPLFRGEYLITLGDGTSFTSTRGHRADLRRALGLP